MPGRLRRVQDRWRSGLSDGAKGLRLLLEQPYWTFRRVESLAFQPSGETTRRVSWDFAVPRRLSIKAGPGRIAVPIAALGKRPLKRLDVRDRSGGALPVWGREQNGDLAAQVLIAGLEALRNGSLDATTRSVVRKIVFARNRDQVAAELDALFSPPVVDDERARDLADAVRGVAETLADGFLLVVELPEDAVEVRTLVKVSYDDDRLGSSEWSGEALTGRFTVPIEVRGWGEAQSWHLEVHAPDGLSVEQLRFEVWDPATLDLKSVGFDGGQASTAHITGGAVSWGYDFDAEVKFAPTTPGLLNQVTLGLLFAALLMLSGAATADGLAERLSTSGRGTSLVALAFSVPAFLLALLARSREHHLVSRVLVAPRLVSFASALCLWAAGLLLAWTAEAEHIRYGLGILFAAQAGLLCWAWRLRPVGGDT